MLFAFPAPSTIAPSPSGENRGALPTWIDLLDPTPSELAFVQDSTGLRLPSRDDLSEIESTSRLYMERDTLYLSTPLIAHAEDGSGRLTPTGFILNKQVLITLRWDKLGAFETVRRSIEGAPELCSSDVFTHVLEAVVDRAADLLERVGTELDALSHETFVSGEKTQGRRSKDPLRARLTLLGQIGDRLSRVRDALLGVGRIAPYAAEAARGWIPAEVQSRLGAVRQDIASLNDYEGHLSTKVQFLLDAVLGFINIEQNDVVKVLTIASTVGVPPVLVAGVYGMNFHVMPELSWKYGYPYSIGLMVVSALLPLVWFRWRGWL